MTKTLFFVLLAAVSLSACRKQSYEEKVMQDMENYNRKEAPKRMDQVTMLDSLVFDPDSRTIVYYYTLEGMADDETLFTDDIRQQQHDGLLNNLKGSIQLRSYKEHELNFEYRYYSKKSGHLIMKFQFSADDYK